MIGNADYWFFIIDTDTYAGNFERELTAWCTGHIGECCVGKGYADSFREECPAMVDAFDDLIIHLPDEYQCYRPTTIYPTPGWSNDGNGHHTHDESGAFPAYQSVAIFCRERPSADVVYFLRQRALAYTPMGRFAQTFTITGFRVMQHIETDAELAAYQPS